MRILFAMSSRSAAAPRDLAPLAVQAAQRIATRRERWRPSQTPTFPERSDFFRARVVFALTGANWGRILFPMMLRITDVDDNTETHCTGAEFYADNAEDRELCDDVGRLTVGESLDVGGGAAPLVRIKRVS